LIPSRIVPLLSGAAAAVLAGCTTTPPARLDSFNLGSNAAGERCAAARNWSDAATPDPFSRAYAITCSSVAASRPLGSVRIVPVEPAAAAAVDAQFDCGDRRDLTIAGNPATAARCFDRQTGLESIRLDLTRGTRRYVAAGAPAILPQVEEALTIAAGLRQPAVAATYVAIASVDAASLPPRAGALAADTAPVPEASASAALTQGIALNHKGLHVEASRVLNDALTRLTPDAPPALQAELLLEAGLADSNIRFPDAAAQHFDAARTIFVATPATRTPFLLRKLDTYRALDAINRGAFNEALATLDRTGGMPGATTRPLEDAATLVALNQPAAGARGMPALADTAQLSRLVLDAQSHYARSIALLGRGDRAGALTEIDAAAAIYRPLTNQRLDQTQLFWLGARIARQQGRLRAQAGDYRAALDHYTTTVELLRRGSIANAGTGSEPAIAEAELERAAVYARAGASRADARSAFRDAVDAVIASGGTAPSGAIGMEDYLDLLVAESGRPAADTYDLFFRAVQATGQPAVARQITELRNVVTADPAVGAAVRERADLERELTRLRYALSSGGEGAPGSSTAELNRARETAENRLLAVDAQLAADPRYRTLDESPATLAELRTALRPGETFLKLTTLNRRIYGMVVTADRTYLYQVAESEAARGAVLQLGEQLRASIDGDLALGKLVPFDEARAYTLYRLVSGPAAPVLAGSRAIVVDPSGPLQQLPVGVLVTRYAAEAPEAPKRDAFDFSRTAFLAANASISTALSPRSFLVSRALPASRAQRAFLGFGQNQPGSPVPAPGAKGEIRVGFGCMVGADRLGTIARSLKPIDGRELNIAAGALGTRDPQFVTGAAFSDTGVEGRSDLDQYEVVHFATHGIEEGLWGCSKSPPALVTSFGQPGSDGLLDFSEIAKLKFDANLVVLSACDTAAGVRGEALRRAVGQEEPGSTLEGLVRAFLTANARSVLATYWQVSAEQESTEFMRSFYGEARTHSIGEALQRAQRTLIAQPQYSHPFYWGPYFLVGDSAKTMLSGGAGTRVAAR
jgi:CHAT domain-containing protein